MRNLRLVQENFGSINDIQLKESEIPSPKNNEVLIEVFSIGVSFADVLAYEGNYQDKPDLPFVAGLEVSGIIIGKGKNINSLDVGDEVIALTKWGGFSEYVTVDIQYVIKKSTKIPHSIGSTTIINYGTSIYTIEDRLACEENCRVMILGASGGIGLACIELLKIKNAEIIAVASSQDKLNECEKYGATDLILREPDKSLKQILKENNVQKVDYIIDTIGGQETIDSLSFLKWEGSLVPMGFASGVISKIPANLILLKNISIVGVFWGPFARGNNSFDLHSISKINDYYDKGLLKIANPRKIKLENYLDAFKAIKERKSIGKLCLITEKYK
tara:strand:- start:3336 stop:4328 length:993 start_codon:yes stop_codon:yes gene_type:complete